MGLGERSFIKILKTEEDKVIIQGNLNPLPAAIETQSKELPKEGMYRARFPDIESMEMLDIFNNTLEKFEIAYDAKYLFEWIE